jgi:hypothetical protein
MTESTLSKVTLHLARTKEYPDGSARHGYDFIAPLDADGRIDLQSWRNRKNACVVHRFWAGAPAVRGQLVHRPGGAGGATWGFDYDPTNRGDDEAGFRFGDHPFKPGEYVSIRDPDGDMNTFKVVSVGPA